VAQELRACQIADSHAFIHPSPDREPPLAFSAKNHSATPESYTLYASMHAHAYSVPSYVGDLLKWGSRASQIPPFHKLSDLINQPHGGGKGGEAKQILQR